MRKAKNQNNSQNNNRNLRSRPSSPTNNKEEPLQKKIMTNKSNQTAETPTGPSKIVTTMNILSAGDMNVDQQLTAELSKINNSNKTFEYGKGQWFPNDKNV